MTSLLSFCHVQQDCQALLAQLSSRWTVPADTLHEAIALQGWQVSYDDLPGEGFCACDTWNQTLILARNFPDQLLCPTRHQEVLHWVLATQLGHIRLHGMLLLKGMSSWLLEHEATDYALAFLLPQTMLQAHPDVAYLGEGQPPRNEAWARMCRVAEYFKVPTRCVQVALEHYAITRPLDFSQEGSQVA
jgi:hypothetical protein